MPSPVNGSKKSAASPTSARPAPTQRRACEANGPVASTGVTRRAPDARRASCGPVAQPLLEERGAVAAHRARGRNGHDHRHIREATVDGREADVADVALHVHLTPVADVAEVLVVRHERDASRPEAARARESESPRDDRAQSVGADDERRADRVRRRQRCAAPARRSRAHRHHAQCRRRERLRAPPRPLGARSRAGWDRARCGAARGRDRERRGSHARRRSHRAAPRRSARGRSCRRDARRPRASTASSAPISLSSRDACGLRYSAQGFGRGKVGAVEHEHARAGACERERRGCARGAASHDDDVEP